MINLRHPNEFRFLEWRKYFVPPDEQADHYFEEHYNSHNLEP
jgi:hypothetical protein